MTDTHAEISKLDDESAGHLASAHVVNGVADGDAGSGGIRSERGSNGVGAHHGLTPIPASIVKAICAVMVTVEAVKKSQRNQHGGYMFASTDDIYAACTRKMGEVQLIPLALEERCDVKRIEKTDKDGKIVVSQWMHAEYSFVLATPTDTWAHPKLKRTLFIQITGPQTFQSSQSFAEKAFLRSLFKIPTGDMDLDSMPQAESEEEQADLLTPRKKKSSSAAKKDGTDAVFNELRGAISGADGPADLQLIKKNHWSVWQQMPERWRQILDEEFDDKLAEFKQMEPAE